jgi:serine/threonine-protein kinase RsbW
VTGPPALARHEIELLMLAIRDHVPGLRAMVAERAMRSDHDLDFVDDVRLAVDEVCAIMLGNCTPEDMLTMRLLVDPDGVAINAWVPLRGEDRADGLSLRVLRALADTLDLWVDDTGTEPVYRLAFARARPSKP